MSHSRAISPVSPANWRRPAPEKPLTAKDAERLREAAYRSKGWRYEWYRYPAGAMLHVERKGVPVPIAHPDISRKSYTAVKERIRRLAEQHKKATIYITIPSKANTL